MMEFQPQNSELSPTRATLRVVARVQKFLKALDTSFEGYSFHKRRFHVTFHPSLSLLVIAASTKLYLWEFPDGMQFPCLVSGVANYSPERNKGTFILQAKTKVEKLSFSNCGNYFVLNFKGKITPNMVEVPSSYPPSSYTYKSPSIRRFYPHVSQEGDSPPNNFSHKPIQSHHILHNENPQLK